MRPLDALLDPDIRCVRRNANSIHQTDPYARGRRLPEPPLPGSRPSSRASGRRGSRPLAVHHSTGQRAAGGEGSPVPALMKVNVDWDRSAGVGRRQHLRLFPRALPQAGLRRASSSPASPLADDHGFREDVLAAVAGGSGRRSSAGPAGASRRLTTGSTASAARGGRATTRRGGSRSRTRSAPVSSSPSAAAGAEPYLCANAGTGSQEEMSNWLEYCNLPAQDPVGAAARGPRPPRAVRRAPVEHRERELRLLGGRRARARAAGVAYVREAARMLRRVDDRVVLAAPP